MDKLSELLKYIHKTNPGMTMDDLVKKLNENSTCAIALFAISCAYNK